MLKYSQVSCVVAFLLYGVSLLIIGHPQGRDLQRAKWMLSLVFMSFGITALLQYIWSQSTDSTRPLDTAIEITTIYASTIVLGMAFLRFYHLFDANSRRKQLRQVWSRYAVSVGLAWSSCLLRHELSNMLIGCALIIYLYELIRVINMTIFSSKKVTQAEQSGGGARGMSPTQHLSRWLQKWLLLLSFFVILCPFLSFMPIKFVAIYNFAAIGVWGYIFISFINFMIFNMKTSITASAGEVEKGEVLVQHSRLQTRLDQWVASGGHRQRGVTMQQVATAIDTNRSYLSEYINSRYGCNFNTWLTRLRIEDAKRLMLASPTLFIEEVGSKVGFSSKSHFMHSFKTVEGMTPGAWRTKQATEAVAPNADNNDGPAEAPAANEGTTNDKPA